MIPYSILPLAFLQNLQGWEILAIVAVIVLLFGGKKLPELARGAGKAIREFKDASKHAEETFKQALHEEDKDAGKPTETSPETKGTTPKA